MQVPAPTPSPQLECVKLFVRPQVGSDEEAHRALAWAAAIAARRAELLGREATTEDLVWAYAAICLWPLKPPTLPENQQFLEALRQNMFRVSGTVPLPVDQVFSDEFLELDLGGSSTLCGTI
jgi:hypothetical protein